MPAEHPLLIVHPESERTPLGSTGRRPRVRGRAKRAVTATPRRLRTVPSNLPGAGLPASMGDDGRLDFVRKYDVDTNDQIMFWMGMATL